MHSFYLVLQQGREIEDIIDSISKKQQFVRFPDIYQIFCWHSQKQPQKFDNVQLTKMEQAGKSNRDEKTNAFLA